MLNDIPSAHHQKYYLLFLYAKLLYSIHQISIMLFNKYFGPYKKTK
jgi:hypothetical protein